MPRTALLALLSILPLGAVADSSEPINATIADAVNRYGSMGSISIPELSASDLETLAAGQPVVRSKVPTDTNTESDTSMMGVVGWQVVPAPRLLVWLATLSAAGEGEKRVTAATLDRKSAGSFVRYQHIDLPWPFADRHWVILSRKDREAAKRTNGKLWAHTWSLASNGEEMAQQAHGDGLISGLSERTLAKSVYLPANRGTWTLIELEPDMTLVFAYFDADLGGVFPASVVRSFTARRLRSSLRSIRDISRDAGGLYDGRPLIHDGFGQPIDPLFAERLAANWRAAD